jgi:hypothetical protein
VCRRGTDQRWTQQDPIQHHADLTQGNRYAYAGGDPTDHTDRSGCYFVVYYLGTTQQVTRVRIGRYTCFAYHSYTNYELWWFGPPLRGGHLIAVWRNLK